MSGLLLALAFTAAAPKAGEDHEIGTLLKPALAPHSNTDQTGARRGLYRIVECAVTRREDVMRHVLDAGDDSSYEKAYRVFPGLRGCRTGGYINDNVDETMFNADHASVRGMIGEAILKNTGKLDGMSALPVEKTYSREWFALTGRPRPIDEMATCVAASDPSAIAALLHTEQETPEEIAAIRSAAPAMGGCLQTGYKLNANPLSLRAALAEALYHRVFDPASTPAETEKAS